MLTMSEILQNHKKKIFISYKREYKSFAIELRDRIQAWGYETWFDQDDIIRPDWRKDIDQGLKESDFIVGVLTPEALESREVQAEWNHGFQRDCLIPIRYKDVSELPYHLEFTQYIDFTDDPAKGFERLRKALKNLETGKNPPSAKPGSSYLTMSSETRQQALTQNRLNRENRQIILEKVKRFWIEGVLEASLTMAGDMQVMISPSKSLKHQTYGEYQLAEDANIYDIFKDVHGELLILGEPGSGKTILLLQLAERLLEDAFDDINTRIPIVVNLSSWSPVYPTFESWLAEELRNQYQVPKSVTKRWVEHVVLTPLLDGLDEVQSSIRDACVKAINEFRREYRDINIAVCSRTQDYETLTETLNISTALVTEPLTDVQIEQYLHAPDLQALRRAIEEDDQIHAFGRVPFLLNAMAVAYRGISYESIRRDLHTGSRTAKLNRLFDVYYQVILTTPDQPLSYSPKQTRDYLHWLSIYPRNQIGIEKAGETR